MENAIINTVRELLLTYSPADRHFTSNAEIEMVCNKLDLKSRSCDELTEIRNHAVEISHEIRESMNTNSDEEFKVWNSMLSITAIIDHVKVNKYGIESL